MSETSPLESITTITDSIGTNPLNDLKLVPEKFGRSLDNLAKEFAPANIIKPGSTLHSMFSKVEIADSNGEKTNAAEVIGALFSVWKRFKKMFEFGKDDESENGEEFDQYEPSELERATASNDQSAAEKAYNEYDKNVDRSKRPRGLMGVGPQRNPKTGTTLCDKSAREFLSDILGVPSNSIQRSGKDAKSTEQLYHSDQKLTSLSQVESYHTSNPNCAFAVFMDSKSVHGHAAAAYFQRMPDGTDRLMIYDPYEKSVAGKERGEAFPIQMHSRVNSMRFVPLAMDRGSMTQQVAKLVSDGSSRDRAIASAGVSLEVTRTGHWEKLPSISHSDLKEISRMVQAEAGRNNIDGQLRVAAVIFNRMMSGGSFPSTALGVLHQKISGNTSKYQFSPMHDGRIDKFQPDQNIIDSIKGMIASGKDPSKGSLFFQAHNIGMDNWAGKNRQQIFTEGSGGHRFFA